MKILFISTSPYLNLAAPTGYAAHMNGVIEGLKAEGHQVSVLIAGGVVIGKNAHTSASAFARFKRFIPSYLWELVKDLRLLRADRKYRRMVSEALDREAPDLIYERLTYLQDAVFRENVRRGIPHFLEVNAPYPEERATLMGNSPLIWVARRRMQRQMRHATAIFAVSSALKNYLEKMAPGMNTPVRVVPNAVKPTQIAAATDILLKDRITIGFVGSMLKWHGVGDLLDAFIELATDNHRLHLLLVGGGEGFSEHVEHARQSPVSERIVFTDNVPPAEVSRYLQDMDICVMAKTNWYGSPIKIFEYGAAAKAIIAPDAGPLRDVMEDGRDALLIRDKGDLKKAIGSLIDNPEIARKMARSFHEKVKSQYTWPMVARTILQEYPKQSSVG